MYVLGCRWITNNSRLFLEEIKIKYLKIRNGHIEHQRTFMSVFYKL
jgi:hypothetical protein